MTEVFHLDRWTRLLGMLCGVFMLLALAACGGGGTGSTSPNTPTGTLTATPSTIALEYGTAPVTVVVSGGVKPYALTSSLQTLIPVGGVADDGRFNIAPAYAPDIATLVTLTIRDAAQTTTTVAVMAKIAASNLSRDGDRRSRHVHDHRRLDSLYRFVEPALHHSQSDRN